MTDQKQIINTFIDLVSIDSESGNEEKVRKFIINYCTKLNFKHKIDSYGNLVVYVAGIGVPIILSSHMDTVKPGIGVVPVVKNGLITSSGNSVLGADDKAGITEILEAINYLKTNKIKHRSVELVFTREEEIGLFGVRNLNFNLLKSKEAIIMDHTGQPTKIVIAAPFIADMEFKIIGKAAHASTPEKGINAIEVAAKAIAKLTIGKIDEETTNNIGIIRGGVIANGVPEECIVKAEARSHLHSKMIKQIKTFKNAFSKTCKEHSCKLEFSFTEKSFGYKHKLNNELIKKMSSTWRKLDQEPTFEKIGGGSDANVYNQHKIKAVPMGSGGQHAHSTKEQIYVSELVDATNFLIEFLRI